ncbi:hypothetical protein S0112_091 [Shewanella phage S0112]|nr:hypothetical protein S0112_091 [Shewanella phage S0112]
MAGDKEQVITLTEAQLKALMTEAVKDAFTSLGIEHNSPIEMQKDFIHLREWRTSTEAIKRKGLLTLVGVAVLFIAGAIAAAAKEYFTN